MRCIQIFIFLLVNLLGANSLALAQPDSDGEIDSHLIKGNKLFHNGAYEKALDHYRIVFEQQPSNNVVLDQINKAEDELLYKTIIDGINAEDRCREYIDKYGSAGKYIFNVKGILGQKLLDQAYNYYNEKDIEPLEDIYIEYLILLGSEKSREMKQWLYLLCIEKAEDYSDQREWGNAQVFFEKSLKYATNDKDFSEAQKGVKTSIKRQ
jgi:tetratricopeptide (TPR) repeat protein